MLGGLKGGARMPHGLGGTLRHSSYLFLYAAFSLF